MRSGPLAILLLALPAWADIAPPIAAPPPTEAQPAAAPPPAQKDWGDVIRAVELPRMVLEIRRKVYPEADVDAGVRLIREAGLNASDAREIVEGAWEGAMAGAPVPDFQAMVKEVLARKLHGADLKAAVVALHPKTAPAPASAPPAPAPAPAAGSTGGTP
jgi:hypothetical protein